MDNLNKRVTFFDPLGVESLRNNGYRETSMAISELIDNSIQASAKNIQIFLVERLSQTSRREWLVDEIFVYDDGCGMSRDELETALRFGGGTRHDATKGLGKFGMGLPNSSASQCKKFEVYTWQKSGEIFYNYFDFEEIKSKRDEFLPEVIVTTLPDGIRKFIPQNSQKGTIVRWTKCDRLFLRRSNKLVPHISWPLGRIYRHYINQSEINIEIRVLQDNGVSFDENRLLRKVVLSVDPLFLMTNTQLPEPYNQESTNVLWQDGVYVFPDPNGDSRNRELYKKIGSSLNIRLSVAKSETKRLGGGQELGLIYREFIGISVLRARREIKIDDFGFLGELGDPLNRWWKIEVAFEPEFDQYFGLDNTKQNVHAFKKIIDKDLIERSAEDIHLEFVCLLSEFIENQIKSMNKYIETIDAGNRKKIKSGSLESPSIVDDGPFPSGALAVPFVEEQVVDLEFERENDQLKVELRSWLLMRYPEYANEERKLALAIDWFFSTKFNQVIVFLQLGAAEFYNFRPIGHRVIIEINTEHDFYLEFLKPVFEEQNTDRIEPILLLFGAMVEAEKELVSYQQYISRFRSLFAVKLNTFILDWKDRK